MSLDKPFADPNTDRRAQIKQMRDAVTDPIPISPSSALGRRRKRLIEAPTRRTHIIIADHFKTTE